MTITRKGRLYFALSLVTLACTAAVLEGGCVDEPDVIICEAGETCTCPPDQNCELACPGGGCDLKCPTDGRCGFHCEDGGCTVSCDSAPTCDLDCAGGGCEMACVGRSDCKLYACPDCPLECSRRSHCDHQD